jgi:hypothetical protein
MPSFFNFQVGDSSRAPNPNDSSPLLGRFRAVPQRNSVIGRRTSIGRGLGLAYGSVFGGLDGGEDSEDGEDEGVGGGAGWTAWRRWGRDLWMEPKQAAVAKAVNRWYSRWAVLVVLPAALVSLCLCLCIYIYGCVVLGRWDFLC